MTRILVGFDEGEESDDALSLANALAESEAAQLDVAVALQYAPVPIDVDVYDRALADHFDEIFAQAERQLGGVEFGRRELRDSSAARALTELAESENPDLLVIGSTHRGAVGRVYPGSVGERLLNGAPCPVAVAPKGFASRERFALSRIGVGYDGTEESRLALREAESLAERSGATLRLIAAVPYMNPMPARIGHTEVGFGDLLETYFRKVLDSGVSTVSDAARIESVMKDGDPAEVLAAQGAEVDLLVLGSRGYGPIMRALLGGVSAEVMRTAPCPVVVVPRSSAEGTDDSRSRAAATEATS